MPTNTKFFMAGTENTGEYVVLARTARGRIGLRVLDGALATLKGASRVRIRVEPIKSTKVVSNMGVHLMADIWKQPGSAGQHRFSTVVEGGGATLKRAITKGLVALGVGQGLQVEINPDLPKWADSLIQGMFAE